MTRARSMAAAICLVLAAPFLAAGSDRSTTITEGRQIFRFDTFGDEQLWTDTLQLHTTVGTIAPVTALGVGLKVDLDALPAEVVDQLRKNLVDLNDPAVTRLLLQLNAVVGVKATVSGNTLTSIGITCAFCHSTVDNALQPGIGHRLDGWPNRDLDVGRIVSLSPVLTDTQRALFTSWGPGKFDPRLQAFDGTQFISLNPTTFPVVIPPAYGLRGVGFETFTADGPISYWNNYVGVSQMGGHGSFNDPRIPLTITQTPDLVTPKLPALLAYQLSLPAPPPPRGVWQHPPYFHDDSAADVAAVVQHYDSTLSLGLTPAQQADLVEFLKSL